MIPAASERKIGNNKKSLCLQNKTLEFPNNVTATYSP